MAVTAHFYPSWDLAANQKQANVATDALQVLLIASGTYTWNATALAAVHVSDFLAGSGGGALTEVATGGGTNYTRQALATAGVSDAISSPNGYTTLTVSVNPQWNTPNFTASYALFFDNTIGGTDSTNQVICYWDLGGIQVAVPAHPFVLQLGSANGVTQALVQWQSA